MCIEHPDLEDDDVVGTCISPVVQYNVQCVIVGTQVHGGRQDLEILVGVPLAILRINELLVGQRERLLSKARLFVEHCQVLEEFKLIAALSHLALLQQ